MNAVEKDKKHQFNTLAEIMQVVLLERNFITYSLQR